MSNRTSNVEDQMKRLENITETIATVGFGFGIGFGITSVILLTQIGLIRW